MIEPELTELESLANTVNDPDQKAQSISEVKNRMEKAHSANQALASTLAAYSNSITKCNSLLAKATPEIGDHWKSATEELKRRLSDKERHFQMAKTQAEETTEKIGKDLAGIVDAKLKTLDQLATDKDHMENDMAAYRRSVRQRCSGKRQMLEREEKLNHLRDRVQKMGTDQVNVLTEVEKREFENLLGEETPWPDLKVKCDTLEKKHRESAELVKELRDQSDGLLPPRPPISWIYFLVLCVLVIGILYYRMAPPLSGQLLPITKLRIRSDTELSPEDMKFYFVKSSGSNFIDKGIYRSSSEFSGVLLKPQSDSSDNLDYQMPLPVTQFSQNYKLIAWNEGFLPREVLSVSDLKRQGLDNGKNNRGFIQPNTAGITLEKVPHDVELKLELPPFYSGIRLTNGTKEIAILHRNGSSSWTAKVPDGDYEMTAIQERLGNKWESTTTTPVTVEDFPLIIKNGTDRAEIQIRNGKLITPDVRSKIFLPFNSNGNIIYRLRHEPPGWNKSVTQGLDALFLFHVLQCSWENGELLFASKNQTGVTNIINRIGIYRSRPNYENPTLDGEFFINLLPKKGENTDTFQQRLAQSSKDDNTFILKQLQNDLKSARESQQISGFRASSIQALEASINSSLSDRSGDILSKLRTGKEKQIFFGGSFEVNDPAAPGTKLNEGELSNTISIASITNIDSTGKVTSTVAFNPKLTNPVTIVLRPKNELQSIEVEIGESSMVQGYDVLLVN